MINLLLITGKLNYTDGVSTHLFNLKTGLKRNKNINLTILCSGGSSVAGFKENGIQVLEDGAFDHTNRSVKNFSSAVKKLIRLIRKNNINIIHSHNHYAANISYYASKLTGIKTIQTIHGLIPQTGLLKHFKAHKYVTVNEAISDILKKKKNINVKDIKFINQGFFLKEEFAEKPNGKTDIICASRLVYEKGIDLFIQAATIVKNNFNGNVNFLIAGTGEYEAELKQLANKIKADVIFLGEVKNLPGVFSKTNIFVMPTRSVSEGLPMTIVEAAFTKNLIITSEFENFGNFFKDNIDGFTFSVGNHEQLAEKLLRALKEPEFAARMAETFHTKSKKLFDPEIMTDKHTELYKECLQT